MGHVRKTDHLALTNTVREDSSYILNNVLYSNLLLQQKLNLVLPSRSKLQNTASFISTETISRTA
jgi:hypothetical protein